ncbi:MAG: hypothetical protein K8R92_04725 [Planctomycetes bacterium]|nr:hypothetical protein [Planctomycetota bacterium]
MTISIAWLRKFKSIEELVFATDSRLSFGCRWDCCPKLLAMPRGDSAMSFAGDTLYAYPVLLQAIAAVSQHQKLLSRGMDLDELKGHMLRVLNNMVGAIHSLPAGAPNEPETSFLFGGWSWKHSTFKIWLLHFDPRLKRFTFRPASRWKGLNDQKLFAFTGDYGPEYKIQLISLLRKKRKLQTGGFDMEPFEVLRDMLRQNNYDRIGGPPQVMKVYKFSSTRPYAVFWPDKASAAVSLLGRPLLNYEQSDYLVLDPDKLKTIKHVDAT